MFPELTINQIRHSAPLKILRLVINRTSEMSHRVECSRTIQDIDIKERDERQPKLSRRTAQIPLINAQSVADSVEGNDFLEEVEVVVSSWVVWEECHGCGTWPGDDGY